MSVAHKAALARGREEGRAVRRYLEALEDHRPRRGRPRTPASIRSRLRVVDERLADADALARLHLAQERDDLEHELDRLAAADELGALERSFVEVARSYAERKGIGYNAWRAAGVSAAVLDRAGIARRPGSAPRRTVAPASGTGRRGSARGPAPGAGPSSAKAAKASTAKRGRRS